MKSAALINFIRLGLACLVMTGVLAFCSFMLTAPESRISLDAFDLTVIVNQPMDSRTLSIVAGNKERVEVKIMAEWGPRLRTNLYKNTDGDLSIIYFGGE